MDEKGQYLDITSLPLSFQEFFNLFIAVYSVMEKDIFDYNDFTRYLKRYYVNNTNILNDISTAVRELEKRGIIRYGEYSGQYKLSDNMPIKEMISKNGRYVEYVLQIIKHFDAYVIKRISDMYDMMIEQEALEMYREIEERKMMEEFEAHVK